MITAAGATDEIELAEHAGRRRARVATVSAAVFLLTLAGSQGEMRAVDHVRVVAWVLWGAVLLAILAGGWGKSLGVRRLMNDEVTLGHRQRGIAMGFWVALGAAAICFVIDRYKPFPAQEACQIIITFGIAAALLGFGQLERRAYARD